MPISPLKDTNVASTASLITQVETNLTCCPAVTIVRSRCGTDYQTKAIVHTLDGHGNNLTSVLYHPRLPLIISACEDGAVRMWHSTTYRSETTLNYGMERSWSLAALPSANTLAIGYDEGTIVLRLGHDTPVVSMDVGGSGKLIWTTNNDVYTASVKGVVTEMGLQDGEKLPLVSRDLGSCEVYPQKVQHNSNGRYVVVCGDGEYIIYTAQQLRNKAFGTALDFSWSPTGTGDYVIRESISKLTLFRNFKEVKSEKPRVLCAEGLFGGTGAIGVKGNDAIAMFDWEELRLIRKIDVVVKNVFWSENGSLVVLACESSFFVLRYNKEVVAQSFAAGTNSPDEGIDGAFDLLYEISEKSRRCICSVMLEYQTAVVRRDFKSANDILPKIPADQMDYVARFLESQGFKEEALALSTDPDQKFDLAAQLAKLDVARDVLLLEIDKVGSPGIGKSTMLLHDGLLSRHENNKVVQFTVSERDKKYATAIYRELRQKGISNVWLLMDGYLSDGIPEGMGTFKMLTTSQPVNLKSGEEGVYCCLLPCWSKTEILSLGSLIFNYNINDMEERFAYSGGSSETVNRLFAVED
ncbi:unnamed protein product [Peronospora belbahrii]|uniref:Beta'-coat protein n=1 Tax=Peronospora belbahrii TaxID=622444 RepID=A0ABN8CXP6_9STRA|nr:unnamed protein product [Peronospora belbahrii]